MSSFCFINWKGFVPARVLFVNDDILSYHQDVNNWWIVKRPDNEDLAVHEPIDVIKDGDIIQVRKWSRCVRTYIRNMNEIRSRHD